MFKKQELTRLGDILVSKGLISPEQLDAAIREQSRRKLLLDPLDPNAKVIPIGEVLIELGFIDRLQLKRGLNWQQRLRRASIAMALCAPFMIFSPSAAASTVRPPPITVQAEAWSAQSGTQNEATNDVGGGQNVGYIDASDWLTYNNIQIPVTGAYKITYRVASLNGGGSIQLKNATTDALLDTAPITKTGSWQTWGEVERTVNLTAGSINLKLFIATGGFNLNWFKIESLDGTVVASSSSSSAAASSVATAETKFPYVIQAENYSTMAGVQKENTTDVGGGQNVGYIDTGDWMSYSNAVIKAPYTGKYKISYRVASSNGGAALSLSDITTNTTLDTAPIPKTGGWQTWTTVEREVTLTAGDHKFTVVASTGGVNLNWIQIEPVTTPMPLTIEAESYSEMSGVKNETATGDGGGINVGYIDTGDWMVYNNTEVLIPNTGKYKVTYRVAGSTPSSLQLYAPTSGAIYDEVPIPTTGGWQKWGNVERIITLPAGKHTFGIKATKVGFNINWFKLERVDDNGNVINTASSSSAPSVVSSSSSSAPAISSASSSSKAVSSAAASSVANTTSSASSVAGPVGLRWTAPSKRENGNYLDITELAGYELRYKKSTDAKFTYVTINDPWTNTYNFPSLNGDYVFQIAAFDKEGVYSPFVDLARQ
jgi:hypothetical protein